MDIPNDLISPGEAAVLLTTSAGTIRRWCHTGRLRGYKIGGMLRVSRADVLAMVQPMEAKMTRQEARAKVAAETDRILREFKVRK